MEDEEMLHAYRENVDHTLQFSKNKQRNGFHFSSKFCFREKLNFEIVFKKNVYV